MSLMCRLKTATFTFLYIFSCVVFAQNGPGAIEDTSGTSDLVLWLDAAKITGVTDLNTVGIWKDISGYGNDASITGTANKPHFRENIVNGNPVVGFNGSAGYLQGSFGGSFGAPCTIIAVPYFNDLNQAANTNDYIISIGSGGGSYKHFSIARRKSSGGDGNRYYSWVNDGSPKLGDTIVAQQWNILSQVNATTSQYHTFYQNGAASTTNDDYSSFPSTDGIYRIGQWYHGGDNRLNGRLAELMVFDKVLSVLELNIIHSYLSAKYDVSIASDYYTGDDPGNGDNDLDVVGIGFDSGSTNSGAESAGLDLDIVSDFDDGDYVLYGHNVSENSVNTSDVNGSIVARWDRAWWLDITNTGDDVNCKFVFSQAKGEIGFGGLDQNDVSDYKLIYKNSPAGSWSIVATASTVIPNAVIFDDVELTADGYYTLGTIDSDSQVGYSPVASGYKGPGGVGETDGSSNLKLWYNVGDMEGESGDEILAIADESGNGNKVTQETHLYIPALEPQFVNDHSAIEFDGANSFLSGTMGFDFTPPMTVFSVAYFNNTNQANDDNDYVYSAGDGLARGEQISLSRRKANDEDDVANINKYYSWDGDTARFGDAITGQQWQVFTQEFKPADSSIMHAASANGSDLSATDNEVLVNTNNSLLSVGRWNGNNHWLDGYFSELIFYDKLLNTAEKNIVESYLGAKYEISVSNDKYSGDDPGNGDFDLDVAGVGTESDGSNNGANSGGLIIEQVSGFENGDYVMVGHKVSNNSINSSDATDHLGQNVSRWDRNWYFDVTNTGDDPVVNLRFDFSDVKAQGFPGSKSGDKAHKSINYNLLFRSGTSGTWTNQSITPTLDGDQVVFSSVTLTSDGYYALGTGNESQSPLPVLLTNFAIRRISPSSAQLEWETASEVSSDYFKIERSADASNYYSIGQIKASGYSNSTKTYALIDQNLRPDDLYYYRLVQYDFNGEYDIYGPIVLNHYDKMNDISVYPNPADEVIHVEGLTGQSEIKFYNSSGKKVLQVNSNNHRIKIPISELREGIYLIHIVNESRTEQLKLLVQ